MTDLREHERKEDSTTPLAENAIEHLLRSPRFDVGTIIDLFDVSDREFRDMARRNPVIEDLLKARRLGQLESRAKDPRECPACGEWFVPYGRARYCSDACRTVGMIEADS